MAAADHVLREALLAVPDSDADAAYLRSFADVLWPVNEEDVPPIFRADGGMPSSDHPKLFFMPLSTRVQPPKTGWLPKAERQRIPPSGFEPVTFGDLLTPEWLDRTWSWFSDLRKWQLDLHAVCDCPESDEA